MSWYTKFAPYVPVAERKRRAENEIEKLKQQGLICQPIIIEGRSIANTFWGKAWCKNLEFYSDYANRLPRGRSYLRNGSVIDLQVAAGTITARVCGYSSFFVNIMIAKVAEPKWHALLKECAGKIDSLIELLQGKFSKSVMQIITDANKGLFPHPKEIHMSCSCPDWADMCKHVAAVLYGIGARLDHHPEELFLLRQADHLELISSATSASFAQQAVGQSDDILENSNLSSLFGIDISDSANADEMKTEQQQAKNNKPLNKKPHRAANIKKTKKRKHKRSSNKKKK